jgi:hypothetical protein
MSTLFHVSAECNGEYQPTITDQREAAEIFATMDLDHWANRAQTFVEFLTDQARIMRLRPDHPWFLWLADQVERLAGEAEYLNAKDIIQFEDRREVMERPCVHTIAALESIRLVAQLSPECLAAELNRAATTLEKAL